MGNVKLTFTPANDATLFRIRRAGADIATDVAKASLTDEGSGKYSYTDNNAPEGSSQTYQVFQKDATGNEDNGSNIVSVTPVAAGGGSSGVELHTQASVASPTNETTDIGGFANISGCSLSIAGVGQSDTTAAHSGDYCLKATAQDGTSDRFNFPITNAQVGDELTVTFWAKRGQGSSQQTAAWYNFSASPSLAIDTSTWKEYSFDVTVAGANPAITFYAAASGAIGDSVYIDDLSIVKTN